MGNKSLKKKWWLCYIANNTSTRSGTRDFPDGSVGKESACNAGDTGDSGLIPELGWSPGGGNGNPFQYSCLENPMDRGAWQVAAKGVTESDTTKWLSMKPEIKLPTYTGSHTQKQENTRETSTSASSTMLKPLTVWKILQEDGITDHLTCLLGNLYAGQGATVKPRHGTTNWFQIGKGVC